MLERYKNTIQVVDDTGEVFELQCFASVVDGREGSLFYRLPNGVPARRLSDEEFEIGIIDKVRVRRR
jgi:hypothetical protein